MYIPTQAELYKSVFCWIQNGHFFPCLLTDPIRFHFQLL